MNTYFSRDKRFINAITPWIQRAVAQAPGFEAENWIPIECIIGVRKCPVTRRELGDTKTRQQYFLMTSFMIGRGINGVDNLLEVIPEVYCEVRAYLGID